MEVKVAKTAGFCFGVKRAVEKAYEVAREKKQKVYTYGPIIHNEEVVEDLRKMGVEVLELSLIHIYLPLNTSLVSFVTIL